MGYYDIKLSGSSRYHFTLKAGNHETILSSEIYESKQGALSGILSCQTNSPLDERYDRQTARDGSPYFNLKAGNGQVIGTSEMYSSTAARDNGIESVKTNGPSTDVRDNT
ncbi:hypothetical protein SAMN05661010_02503 [Modicisalibacter muralis]|uniref:DUF1508 domain-containing protein n=2 Tax=Modicisalibacter muralis TaxID=119000 RepID=A0A1G9MSM0_9GAMM|nr:hypothetical protein SAMN05661010_02503 [Halomonas muralis]